MAREQDVDERGANAEQRSGEQRQDRNQTTRRSTQPESRSGGGPGSRSSSGDSRTSSSRSIAPRGPSERSVSPYRSPFDLMSRWSQRMDRVFEDFWRHPFGGDGGESSIASWMPDVEIHRHGDELVVRADLPGMKKEDVQVEVAEGALTIRGERRQECEDSDDGHYRSECSYGSFFRSIPLPPEAEAEEAKAEFKNGVLEVHVPAPERKSSRTSIEVRGDDR